MHIIEGIFSYLLLYSTNYLLGGKDTALGSLFVMHVRGLFLSLPLFKTQAKKYPTKPNHNINAKQITQKTPHPN